MDCAFHSLDPPRDDVTAGTTKDDLLARLKPHGQEHLLAYWDELAPREQAVLADEILSVDLQLVEELFQHPPSADDIEERARRATGPPAFRLGADAEQIESARKRGREALAAGRVGVVLVAGGQGTRLGFDQAKGLFPIGPVSHATLFQILCEKVLAVARRHKVTIPLYVMTSPATHDETVDYLAAQQYFGLPKDDVRIFCQGTMPAVDDESGKILVAERGRLCLSPDGHGGALAALARRGLLDDMAQRGLEHVFYMQVDNPLVRACDEEFLGYHVQSQAEVSTQVVAKRRPDERVGNVVSIDDRVQIIEYSDLPPELAERHEPDGSLTSWAGSIAVHYFDRGFLQRMASGRGKLPFHVAHKKVAHLDEQGELVEPDSENAVKFERFIFDLLPFAERSIVMEVDPANAFAPVKNAPDASSDTAELAQRQMVALHTDWLRQAGARVDEGVAVEISPLFALDAADVAVKIEPDRHVTDPLYLR